MNEGAKRSIDPGIPLVYQTSLNPNQIHVVYLDELNGNSSSIGLGIIRMVVASENEAVQEAKALINQVQQADATSRRNLLELGASQMFKNIFCHCERNVMERKAYGIASLNAQRVRQDLAIAKSRYCVRGACPKDLCFIPLRYIKPFGHGFA